MLAFLWWDKVCGVVSGGLLRWMEEVELSSEVEWLQQVRLEKF